MVGKLCRFAAISAVLLLAVSVSAALAGGNLGNVGTFHKWHKVEIVLTGPSTSVTATPNPFAVLVNVTFSGPGGSFVVPAFYDGNGSGGTSGNVWKVRFSANATGSWTFSSSSSDATLNGYTGSFTVDEAPDSACNFLRWGRLQYVGGHYLKFADGPYWIKAGLDDPENPLGGGFGSDWNAKKSAMDTLNSKGVNSLYAIMNNVDGDGNDTWPFLGSTSSEAKSYGNRFNPAKLLLWEDFFNYCDSKGVALHLVFNDDSCWGGYDQSLYIREMVARFGHHPAILWNVGEEANEMMNDSAQISFANTIKSCDPYDHPVTVHRQSTSGSNWPFLGNSAFDFTSIQESPGGAEDFTSATLDNNNAIVINNRNGSVSGGRPIPIMIDEPPRITAVDTTIRLKFRSKVLYPVFLGGGHHEIHYRDTYVQGGSVTLSTLSPVFDDMRYARQFVETLPFDQMSPNNSLLSSTSEKYCLAKPGLAYGIYMASGATINLNLSGIKGAFQVKWYNVTTGATSNGPIIHGGSWRSLGAPAYTGDVACSVVRTVAYPGSSWSTATPSDLGVDSTKLTSFASTVGGNGMIVKDGYIVHQWGTPSTKINWASAGKGANATALFIAIHEGRTTMDTPIYPGYWPAAAGKDRNITFRHMSNMLSGYRRPENPGAAWSYSDYNVALFTTTLYQKVFSSDPQTIMTNRFSPLQFQDGLSWDTGTNYGRLISCSGRDFARIGWMWANSGKWSSSTIVPSTYFDQFRKVSVSSSVPQSSGSDTSDYLGVGTYGGGTQQTTQGPGEYGYFWWQNDNSYWADAPADTFMADGHWGGEAMAIIPSLGMVAVSDGTWGTLDGVTRNSLLKLLKESVVGSSDSEAPTKPYNLAAAALTAPVAGAIQVTWSPASDNYAVKQYRVYRNGTQIGTSSTTSYTDTTATINTRYLYTVSAVDFANNASGQSAPVQILIQGTDTTPPSVPTNVSATAQSQSSIQITWSASTDNVAVTGYKVYRNGSQVGTSTTTSYLATGLSASTTYSYTVSAYDAANNNSSQSSPPATATTFAPDIQAPSVPTNVQASAQSSSSISVTWTASTDNVGVTGYKVFRNGSQVGTSPTTSYLDTGLSPSTTYSYTVSAYDAANNNSAQSSPPATATTQVAPTTIYANDDCYVENGVNKDDLGILVKTVSNRNGWFEFTLAGSSVSSAKLRVYDTSSTSDTAIQVKAGVYNFNESTFTGVDTTSWTTITYFDATGGAAKWYEIDITSFYNSNLGQTVTFNFIPTLSPGDAGWFEDRENSKGTGNLPHILCAPTGGDNQAPSVPTNVQATAQSSSSINVTWTASTDNVGVTGYKVFRNGSQVGTSATTSYLDTGLSASTTYSYKVSAYDAANNNSAQSAQATATTQSVGTNYLDNGIVRIEVDLTRGGAINWFGQSGGSSQININDLGRYCQQSYYSGPWPFGSPHSSYPNWGWNPIQVGDVYGNKATVLDHSNNGTTLYVKTLPKQWALNNVNGDCTFEQWITLTGSEARVRCRLNNGRSDTNYYGPCDQEQPALYTIGTLYKLYTYTGSSPFTGGALTEIVNSGPPWDYWDATENWAAHVNSSNWGVGVYSPGSDRFAGGFYGTKGSGGPTSSQTSYITPLGFEVLDYNRAYEYNYVLILGNLTDIRNRVYAIQPAKIYASDDTFTAEATPTTALNNQGIWAKKHTDNRRYGWLEFVFGTQAVESARLNLYQYEISWGTWHTIAVKAKEYDLSESLTWNTQPDVSAWTSLWSWSTRNNRVGWYSVDITNFYNANLGKRITFQLSVTGGSTGDVGGRYEDSENTMGSGKVPYIGIMGAVGDMQAPSIPANVQAAAQSSSSIQVTWTASTDNVGVTGYKVFRNGSQIDTTSNTSYLDTGLSSSTTYSYKVSAYDAANNESAQSAQATATTQAPTDTTPPSVPTNVSAIAQSSSSIQVTWTASTDNVGVTGYKVFRNGSQIDTTANASYLDTGLTPSTTYSYTVSAYDAASNNSAQSSPPAVATTDSATLSITNVAPTNYVVATFDLGSLTFIDRTYTISTMPTAYRGLTGIRTANNDKDNTSLDFHFTINQEAIVYVVLRSVLTPNTTLLSGFVDTGDVITTTDLSPQYKVWQKTYSAGVVSLGPKPNAGDNNSMYFVLVELTAPDVQSPSVPTNVAAIAQSETSIKVTWTASTDNVGVTGYKVYRNGSQIDTTTNTSYLNTGLTVNTTYSYTVSAYDAANNNSAQSSPAAVATTPDSTAPSVPTNVAAVAQSGTSIQVTWTASTDNVGVTGYKVYRNGSQIDTSATTSYLDTGLSAGTTYSYTISAYDAASNNSAQSSPAAVETTPSGPDTTPPSVPTNVQAAAQSETSIQVTWTASTDNVGVTGYKVYRNGSQIDTSATTSYLDTGLSAGTTYSYTVSAYDAASNNSAQSSPASVETTQDNTSPSVPTNVQASAQSETSIQVTWTASTDNVGVTGYKVYRNGSQIDTSATTSYLDTGLSAGTTYSYTVSAYDAASNNSAQSSPAAVESTPDNTAPSVPTNVQAAAQSETSIQVTWTASTDNVGVTGYKIYRNGSQIDTSATTSYLDTGLSAGTTYSYKVSAYDAASNNSAQSAQATATTPDNTSPSVPTGVSATAQSSSLINVTWTASTDNVGVTGYKVYRNGGQITTTSNTSYLDTGLSVSTTYSYTISAYDAANNNSAQSSPPATATTHSAADTTPPSVPTNVAAVAQSQTSIGVSWTASTDNVGVTGYKVYRNGTQIGTSATTSYLSTGLSTNTTYSYTVSAYDAASNNSAQSSPAAVETTLPGDITMSNWHAEFSSISGSGPAGYTSPYSSSTGGSGGNFSVTYNQSLPTNWLSVSSGALVFDALGVSSRGRFAATHTISGSGGSAVAYRLQMVNTTITRGPMQFTVYDGSTPYNCYVRYNNSTITILNNSGGTYSNINSYSKSMSGYHTWCLAVKVGGGYAHWNLWIDGERLAFGGTDGNHTSDGVQYSFRTATNSFTAIGGNAYIGLGELNKQSGWKFNYDWVRWTNQGAVYFGDPYFNSNPAGQSKTAGQTATFSVSTWSEGTASYQWQVKPSGGVWTNISGATSSSYTTPTLSVGDNGNQYRCRARRGNWPYVYSKSATLEVLSSDTTPPSVPTNVQATAQSSSSINVTWTASTDNVGVTGYKVFRNGSQVATSATTSYLDTGLSSSTTYSYKVSAYDAANNNSAQSAQATATTQAEPPWSINPNDDTYTYSSSTSTNYDNQGLLVKYASPTNRYSWLEFTIGGSSVSSAVLNIYNTTNIGTNLTIELRSAQYSFSEGSLTWSNQPNADAWTSLGTWTMNATGWYTKDITSFYNSHLGQTITIRVRSTTNYAQTGPFLEDRENSKGSGNEPYIYCTP